jgi:hypothetical protein
MLTLKPTELGSGKLKADFVVLDADRKTVGRMDARGVEGDILVLDDHRAGAAIPA